MTPVPSYIGSGVFCWGSIMKKRLLQIYTGDGKGKTTAATGLILRALGHSWRVLLVRFLKTAVPPSGEVEMLRKLPGIRIIDAQQGGVYAAGDSVLLVADVARTFEAARKALEERYDLVVLDEFNGLFRKGYLPLERGLELIRQRPPETELVLTGRHAPPELIELADLVSEVSARKHPWVDGISARPGIEY